MDQLNIPQHARADSSQHHVWCMLPVYEEHCYLGHGSHLDPPSKSHLCWLYCVHHSMDGRASLTSYYCYVGHCSWCSGGGLFIEIALGLLVVVLGLHTFGRPRLLLHSSDILVLAYGRF